MSVALAPPQPPGLKAGMAVFGLWLLLAAGAAVLAPHDPEAQDLMRLLQGPGAVHWLGTDKLGRDLASRIIYGARTDLAMSVLGVFPPFVIGCAIGALAGALGGPLSVLLGGVIDVLEGFPRIVLVLLAVAALGGDPRSYFLALALATWPAYARLTRAEWRRVRRSAFVRAAEGLGFRQCRIHLQHILPNALTPAIARAPGDVVRLLLLAVALGYFGLGVPPGAPEWGALLAEAQPLLPAAWWMAVFPGLACLSLAMALNRLGDGVAARLAERG